MQDHDNDSMQHSAEQASDADGIPKFGRLLIVLAFAVAIVVALTFGSMAYYAT